MRNRVGLVDEATMRKFDTQFLVHVSPRTPEKIKALRERR
jgi:DNA-binding transcriptional regulator YiaG